MTCRRWAARPARTAAACGRSRPPPWIAPARASWRVPQALKLARRGGPVRHDLDLQLQVHRPVEQRPDLLARRDADVADHRPALADDDAALAVALDQDQRIDDHVAF